MKIRVFLCVLVIIYLFCACSSAEECDPLRIDNADYLFAFDIVNVDKETKKIVNTGVPINLEIMYSNGKITEKNSFGLLLFVNGILHEYMLDDKTYDMKIINLNEGEYGTLNVNFVPKIGDIGDTLILYVCSVIKPAENIEPETFIAFEDRAYMVSSLPFYVNNAVSSGGSGINALYLSVYTDAESQNANTNAQFTLLPRDYSYINAVRGEKQNLTLHCAGGAVAKKYRVSLFINNTLTPVFDGHSYMDITIAPGQQANYTFEIDTAVLPDASTIYALAVPLEINVDEFATVQQTNNIALFLSNE